MESPIIGIILGTFIFLMGIYLVINPQFGFKINHMLEKKSREATPRDLMMMRVSGVVCTALGLVILAGMLGIIG